MKQLFLRTCDKDFQSHGGFQWPNKVGAEVVAPDWKPTGMCGNGLHGCLEGKGSWGYLCLYPNTVWMVVEAENAIDLDGKHKFEKCLIKHIGDVVSSLDYLEAQGIQDLPYKKGGVGADIQGDYQCISVGAYGTAITEEDSSLAIAGFGGKASCGYEGRAQAGIGGMVSGGLGSDLYLAYRNENGEIRWKRIHVCKFVDANTWYKLDENHNFVEVEA